MRPVSTVLENSLLALLIFIDEDLHLRLIDLNRFHQLVDQSKIWKGIII